MITSLPPYKSRGSLAIAYASLAVTLLLSPALLKLGVEQRKKLSIADQFESRRALILSRINTAVDRQDLTTLTRINNKYSSSVTDGTFQASIREALAKVTAHEAQLELVVSRHLDLLRHREESPLSYDPKRPQVAADKQPPDQPLSKLPR